MRIKAYPDDIIDLITKGKERKEVKEEKERLNEDRSDNVYKDQPTEYDALVSIVNQEESTGKNLRNLESAARTAKRFHAPYIEYRADFLNGLCQFVYGLNFEERFGSIKFLDSFIKNQRITEEERKNYFERVEGEYNVYSIKVRDWISPDEYEYSVNSMFLKYDESMYISERGQFEIIVYFLKGGTIMIIEDPKSEFAARLYSNIGQRKKDANIIYFIAVSISEDENPYGNLCLAIKKECLGSSKDIPEKVKAYLDCYGVPIIAKKFSNRWKTFNPLTIK